MSKSNKIDNLISNLYRDKSYRELKALSKLFSRKFINELEAILNNGCMNKQNFKEQFDVSLGWIDKIPLASFKGDVKDINGNRITNKVELGDLLIVSTFSQVFQKQQKLEIQNRDTRAIIIQAKISNKRNPNVPIARMSKTKVTSTSKELALLSKWPQFDLYKSSRSKNEELKDLKLCRNSASAKFAGFYDRQWDCGDPDFGTCCDLTLGELIDRIIDKKEGCDFDANNNSKDWDRLINKLLTLCGSYGLPGYIFGKNKSRLVNSGTLYFNPFIMLMDFFRKKKFPILVINRVFVEGEFE